jgi:hypothetical protein
MGCDDGMMYDTRYVRHGQLACMESLEGGTKTSRFLDLALHNHRRSTLKCPGGQAARKIAI